MPNLYIYIGGILLAASAIVLQFGFANMFDISTVQWFSQHRTPVLDALTQVFALMGGMPFVSILTVLWCLYFLLKQQYGLVLFIVAGIIGSIIIGWSLKWAIDRPRPEVIYAIVKSYGPSFPSAHSLYAATLVSLGACIYRKQNVYWVALGILWWFTMGISRIYAGVHFPTDVFAGWGLGFLWIALLWQLRLRINQNALGLF
ncbi:phosphatase PAP2 family protein [Acinetobacter sp. MD2(2019)]|uniref:phosphatase PAP2 family protein n=1 Tax=Acinetobacter sp. MD2(2019) TaxID=2605273 RepID=UPI002D1F7602|nr:phosphatase PAP2 family protein [Acinetobacter sp. MD2(2019)]MEB3753913.1 phosphatase PAP2 family protein [Acinetobacter sp. MD2(2019)]